MTRIRSRSGTEPRARCIPRATLLLLGLPGLLLLSRPAHGDDRLLSIDEAVTTALSHNGELQIARRDAAIAADEVDLARSAYDPSLFGRAFASRDEVPGSATSFSYGDRQLGGDAGISGKLKTGLEFSVSGSILTQKNDDPFGTVYDPAHTSALTLSVTQPLLRGAWGPANGQVIVVASLRMQQNQHLLRAQVERTVSSVEVAYWNLVRAHKEREARDASLKLALEQLEESRRLVRLGANSQLDVTEAQTGVSRRQQELQSSNEDVAEAEGLLLDLLQVQHGEPGWKADDVVVPTDSPDVVEVSTSLDEHVALARKHRPDLLAARRLTDAEVAALEVTGNATRPALDLVARAGLLGFAGDLADSYATAGVNQMTGGLDPPYFSDPELEGGLATSLENLVSGDHYGLYLGLRFELPLRNQAAEARHSIQRHQLAKARSAQRSLQARIHNEVRTSLNRLKASAAIVTAADEAVALSGRLLEGTRQRFRNDASTSFDVLRVLDELTRSKIEAARARARYQIALSRLAAANGTLLDRRGITIQAAPR